MKIYNKGARGFVISREDAISGCRLPTDEIGKFKAYIDPGSTVSVTDEVGAKLMKMYPANLVCLEGDCKERLDQAHKELEKEKKATPKKNPAAKAKAKAKPVKKVYGPAVKAKARVKAKGKK